MLDDLSIIPRTEYINSAKSALVKKLNENSVNKIYTLDDLNNSNIVSKEVLDAWTEAYVSAYVADKNRETYMDSIMESQYDEEKIHAADKDFYNSICGLVIYKWLPEEGLYAQSKMDSFEYWLFNSSFKILEDGSVSFKEDSFLVQDSNDERLDSSKTNIKNNITNFWEAITKFVGNLIEVKDSFNEAKPTEPISVDPILLDLDGDGFETTTVESGICFDHEGDGFKEISAWVGSDDGILAYDKNNNGIIDNGNEIFGDNYIKSDGTKASSGFDALSDLDSNNDGVIDANDEKFSDIKIIKGDGTIISLADACISSISLSTTTTSSTDANGNTQLSSGTFTKTDGTTGNLGDFSLITDKVYSVASDIIEVSDEISELPNVRGYGTVRSLHQAMARDSVLTNLVQQFVRETKLSTKQTILKNIIYQWTGANNIDSNSRGENIDAQLLYVLEKFMGEGFTGTEGTNIPNDQAANILRAAYSKLSNYIYSQLESQTALKSLYDLIQIEFDSNDKLILNINNIKNTISEALSTNETCKRGGFCKTRSNFNGN